MLTRISKSLEAEGDHQVVDDQRRFDVAGVGGGADGVEVALPELAVAALAGVLAAPDRAHVIALERRAELADVLGREAGERHRQVEAQGHVAVAMIAEAVDELVGFVAALAEQDLGVFQGRRVDRREAVGAIDAPGLFQQLLARDHQFRQIIAETL